MRVVIAGGHGQIALLLAAQLVAADHTPVGLIRRREQESDLRGAGAEPVVLDLESSTVEQVAAAVRGADAVVFAAGAGPGSTAERKLTVDRDGATLLLAAAAAAGVRRYVIVSAIATDDFDPTSDEVFQVYLRAKSEADAAVRASDLDWTIVRPGGLTDDPGAGLVRIAPVTGRGSIPRADVAAVIVACLDRDDTIGRQFELVSGTDRIDAALDALRP